MTREMQFFLGGRLRWFWVLFRRNISMTSVSIAVAIAIPASPHIRMAMTVAIEEARMLTKLLPINMTLIS